MFTFIFGLIGGILVEKYFGVFDLVKSKVKQ